MTTYMCERCGKTIDLNVPWNVTDMALYRKGWDVHIFNGKVTYTCDWCNRRTMK